MIDPTVLRQLCEQATPGPWRAELYRDHPTQGPVLYDTKEYFASAQWRTHGPSPEEQDAMVAQIEADFEFIAAAREALPQLLYENAALRAERDFFRDAGKAETAYQLERAERAESRLAALKTAGEKVVEWGESVMRKAQQDAVDAGCDVKLLSPLDAFSKLLRSDP